jgi:hypothetical protein
MCIGAFQALESVVASELTLAEGMTMTQTNAEHPICWRHKFGISEFQS